MPEIQSAYVAIYPKFDANFSATIKAEMAAAGRQGGQALDQAIRGTGEKVGKDTGEGISRGLKSSSGMLRTAMTALAATGIAAFVKQAVGNFAQLEDATAAASVVFGKSMTKIIEQSKTAAATLGMSRSQIIDAANTFGTFGKAGGLAGDALAEFSMQMTQLAGDMASFRGTSPEQAIQAIGAALRGETEPIRAYGVLLDEASVKAQALKMGLIATTKDALQPQARVLAVQKLILEQTTLAQGDFARTADSTANTQKTLSATVQNLSADIGGKLAPMVRDGERALIGLLRIVQDNTSAIGPLIQLIGGIGIAVGSALAIGKLVDLVKGLRDGMQNAQASIQKFGEKLQELGDNANTTKLNGVAGAVKGIGRALPLISVAATLAGAAFVYFGAKAEASKARVEALTDAILADNNALGDNYRKTVAKTLADNGSLAAADRLGISIEDVTLAHEGNADALDRVRRRLDEVKPLLLGEADASGQAAQDVDTLTGSLDGMNTETKTAITNAKLKAAAEKAGTPIASDYADATNDIAASAKDSAEALKAQADATWAALDAALAASGNEIAYQEAIDRATDAVKENGKTLDINTEAGRNNKRALDEIARSGEANIKWMTDNNAKSDEVASKTQQVRDQFIKAAIEMGKTKDEAAKLADQYGLIPRDVATKVTMQVLMDSVDQVESFVERAKARYRTQANGGLMRFYAGGGMENHIAQIAPAGSWRIWGEPETGGEAYIPLAASKRSRSLAIWRQTGVELGAMPAVGGGMGGPQITIPVQVSERFDPEEAGRLLSWSLR